MSLVFFVFIRYNEKMLKDTLQKDQITALKAGDKIKLSVVRYIVAQIKNKEIEKKIPLTDEEIIAVLRKYQKELKESIEAFEKGNRADLIAESKAQYDIAASYLPAEMSDEQLKQEVEALVQANQAAYQKNPKYIIGICMKELRQKADPAKIMKLLEQYTQ